MKNKFIYFFILFPVISFGQCPRWIGNHIDSTLALEKTAEKYLEVPLEKIVEEHYKADYEFQNETCHCEFLIITGKQKVKGEKQYTGVNEIVINGPPKMVKKMYMEYFFNLMKPCAENVKPTSFVSNGVHVGYYTIPWHGKKIGQINLHK